MIIGKRTENGWRESSVHRSHCCADEADGICGSFGNWGKSFRQEIQITGRGQAEYSGKMYAV